jgi:transposase
MQAVYTRCAGLDVHRATVMVCMRILEQGCQLRQEVRSFSTMTRDLLALADWLTQAGVTHVAMESTGVYWKPIWNLLEDRFHLLLVNAQHIKQVPGRKTDVKDCEWIAQLLQCGLLRGSFVPPVGQRQLRDLTRMRATLVQETNRVSNRIHKVLEDANIKLASVASDVLGVSGRHMLERIVAGEDNAAQLAELARGRLRAKLPELRQALEGRLTEHHRFVLQSLLTHLEFLAHQIEQLDTRIEQLTRPFQGAVQLLTTAPGIQRRTAENLIAEIGLDMSQFPSGAHLTSWGGICPGNHESAGKRKTGKTPKGNRWLRRTLGEAAWAAARTKNTYLAARYRRLAARRGKKRAIVAISHSILIAVYHMLKNGVPYHELGADHFDRLDPQRLKRHLVRRLSDLGYEVTLKPLEAVA